MSGEKLDQEYKSNFKKQVQSKKIIESKRKLIRVKQTPFESKETLRDKIDSKIFKRKMTFAVLRFGFVFIVLPLILGEIGYLLKLSNWVYQFIIMPLYVLLGLYVYFGFQMLKCPKCGKIFSDYKKRRQSLNFKILRGRVCAHCGLTI